MRFKKGTSFLSFFKKMHRCGGGPQPGHAGDLCKADAVGCGGAHHVGDQCAKRAGQNDWHQGIERILDGRHVFLVADFSGNDEQLFTGGICELAHFFSSFHTFLFRTGAEPNLQLYYSVMVSNNSNARFSAIIAEI
ncbi:hypothetical protein MR478_07320 [bacterium]|nr:hypothetical protein [bacterium]